MKITSIDTFEVDPRWLFVRIDTDSGIVGWGEATLEGSSDVVTTAVKAFAERLVGTEPRRTTAPTASSKQQQMPSDCRS